MVTTGDPHFKKPPYGNHYDSGNLSGAIANHPQIDPFLGGIKHRHMGGLRNNCGSGDMEMTMVISMDIPGSSR